ncbi:MAG: ribonuclease E [Methylibium sp. NZG]|nr:MAG: ribonuclease E [Methylibium sp. NZG]
MKRMLINATQPEERRLAIVEGQKLMDFETEIEGREQRKGNIYKAVVTRVEPSLEACFVDYGEDRHGFLPFKEISKNYFREGADVRSARIQDVIRDGDNLLVQVEKEERGNKGAALTTFVSLAGRYLVLMPNNPRGGGVSRRIEGEDREELKENLDQLEYPKGMSLIARTAGIGRTAPELQWDLNYMLKLWTAIDGASKAGKGAFLIYQESSLVIRAIRDYFTADIGEILIDTDDIFDQAQQFMSHVMPETAHKVKRYRDDAPLFSRFQIEHQIETAFSRTVNLPSGGAIVIDHTEALVSVDVNSARSTRGSDIEETATRTNLEAADEIARQMRLRDLGGLIVVDFIDMDESKNRREVETRLRDALRQDRARVQFSSISKFGLLEMSRQRLRPALSEGSHITCPRCNGTGHIRDTESSALQILRMVQEESMKDNTAAVHVQVPVEVTSFLLNEKRTEITKIELKQRVTVLLVPNKNLETPNYRLERLRQDDPRLENLQASYTMIDDVEEEVGITRREKAKAKQEPVIKGILPESPAPVAEPKPAPVTAAPAAVAAPAPVVAAPAATPAGGGFFGWVKRLFGGEEPPVAVAQPAARAATASASAAAAAAATGDKTEGRGDRGARGGRGGRDGKRGGRDEQGDGRGRGRNDRGERNDRADRPKAVDGARGEGPDAARSEERKPRGDGRGEGRPEGRPEGRGDGRGEGRGPGRGDGSGEGRGNGRGEGSDGRADNRGRGPRQDRETQRANPMPEGALEEGASARAFVDTVPGAPETDGAAGEPTAGRGRRRRGGRGGRDRDESRDGAGLNGQAAALASDASTASFDATGLSAGAASAVGLPSESRDSDAGPADGGDTDREAGGERSESGEAGDRGERGEGRRRGRGGRDRNRRDRVEGAGTPTEGAAETVGDSRPTHDAESAPAFASSGAATVAAAAWGASESPAAVRAVESPAESALEAVPEPTPATAPWRAAPAEASVAAEPVLAPAPVKSTSSPAVPTAAPVAAMAASATAQPVAPFVLPVSSLQAVVASSGLEWIGSDAEKVRAVREAMANEPKPLHVPREPKPVVLADDGPLVLVETRKDLSQIKLPFEAAPPAPGQ